MGILKLIIMLGGVVKILQNLVKRKQTGSIVIRRKLVILAMLLLIASFPVNSYAFANIQIAQAARTERTIIYPELQDHAQTSENKFFFFFVDSVKDLMVNVGQAIINGVGQMAETGRNGFTKAEDGLLVAASKTSKGLDKAGSAINNGIDKAGLTIHNGVSETGKIIAGAGSKIIMAPKKSYERGKVLGATVSRQPSHNFIDQTSDWFKDIGGKIKSFFAFRTKNNRKPQTVPTDKNQNTFQETVNMIRDGADADSDKQTSAAYNSNNSNSNSNQSVSNQLNSTGNATVNGSLVVVGNIQSKAVITDRLVVSNKPIVTVVTDLIKKTDPNDMAFADFEVANQLWVGAGINYGGSLIPSQHDQYDIGDLEHYVRKAYISSIAASGLYLSGNGEMQVGGKSYFKDDVDVNGKLHVTGQVQFNSTLKVSDEVTIKGIATTEHLLPDRTSTDNAYDIGSTSLRYRSGYFGASLYVANSNIVNDVLTIGGVTSSGDVTITGALTVTGIQNYTGQVTITSTTVPQQSIRYDASNYLTTAISSAGAVTFNATGASAGFTFSDAIGITGNLTVTGHILPVADNTYNLGSATAVWANGYFTNVLAGTGDALTITANAASTWSTSSGLLSITGAGGITHTSTGGTYTLNAAGQAVDLDSASYALDTTGAFSIDGAAASNISTTAADLTLSTITSGSLILTSAGLVDLNAAANLDIDVTGAYDVLATSTFSIDGTGASNVSATSGNLTVSTLTSGNLVISSVAEVDLDGTTVSIDGSTAINIGTSADKPIDIDSTTLDIDSSGAITIDTANQAITIDSGTGTMGFGTSNNAKQIDIGIGTAIDTINIGTGSTGVDVISIGQAAASVAITDADWSITTTGVITTTGLANLNGGLAIDTDNFTVSGTSGITTLQSSATTGNLLAISSDTITTTGAYKGAYIDLTNVTPDATNTVYGLHINDQASTTTSTEYGIYVQGANWDYGLYVEDASYFGGAVTYAGGAQFDGTVTVDVTNAEALLVRKDADALDVFTVGTNDATNITLNPATTGDIVMTLDTDGGSILDINDTANTTTTAIDITNTALTSGTALSIAQSTSSFIGKLLNLQASGGGVGTAYGLYSTLTGAATTNIAGYFSATGATTNYGLVVENGLSGFGTATPSSTVHIVGQCVTGDTLLRRRRRRKSKKQKAKSKNTNQNVKIYKDDDFIYDQCRIDQIKEGDEVLSLNEATGKFEYRKVRALMDMGKQKVYKLITESGKMIETTAEHPYLTKDRKWQKVSALKAGIEIAVASEQIKNPAPRTYVFIDASNIIYGCRDSNWQMDFAKLYSYLKNRFNAQRVLYYAGVEEWNAKQLNFYNLLRRFGYELVLKPVKTYRQEDGSFIRKANVDVDLTFEAMLYFNDYDRAVFLTGDGDFYRLIAHCKANKEKIWLIGNARRTAKELKTLMNYEFMNLDDLKSSLSYYENKNEADPTIVSASCFMFSSYPKQNILSSPNLTWEKIVSITETGKKATFDIEIADTHNFIGGHYLNTRTGKALTQEEEALYLIWKNSKLETLNSKQFSKFKIQNSKLFEHLDLEHSNLFRISDLEIRIYDEDIIFGGIVAHNTYINSSTATGTALDIDANSLTSGTGLDVSSSATAFTGNLLNLTLSGSNALNTGSLLQLLNSGTLNTNTSLYVKHYATGTGNLAMRVDDADGDTTPFVIDGSGNVGIGTTGPGTTLPTTFTSHADSKILQISSASASGDAGLAIRRTDNNTGLDLWNDGNTGATYIDSRWNGSGGQMYLRTSTGGTTVNAMTIQYNGNVGIGTTGPTGLLDVNNGTTQTITASANARIVNIQGALTEAASGVHARIAGVEITPPTITAGVATVTDTASLYISAAPTATVTGANYALWSDAGTNLFDGDTIVGGSTSTTETLANTGFVMGGDDLFVAGMMGIEGSVYTDGSFIAGATTTYGDGSILGSAALSVSSTSADLTLQTTTSGNIAINPASTSDIVMTLDTDGSNIQVTSVNTATDTLGIVADSQTTADVIDISADGLTTGTIFNLTSTSTAGGASGASYMLKSVRTGANSNASHTAYGIYSDIQNTGTTSVNIGAYFSASGATTNLAVALANNEWLGSVDNAGTGYVNMMKINASDELEIGAAISSGTIEFAQDTGVATLVDMPVSATPSAGTEMSTYFKIGTSSIAAIYAEASGTANTIQNGQLRGIAATALTNAVGFPFRARHLTSGTPAAGIGTGIQFDTETAANNYEIGAAIEAVTTDVTATSEDFDLVFKTMAAGAAATEAARITSDGRIQMTTWTADGDTLVYKDDGTGKIGIVTSDIRLKKNIVPIDSALDKIGQLQGFLYNSVDEGDDAKKRLGLSAQDVMAVLPEAAFSFTNEAGEEYYSVHYEKLTALLVEGIKQQQGQIEDLRQDLDQAITELELQAGKSTFENLTVTGKAEIGELKVGKIAADNLEVTEILTVKTLKVTENAEVSGILTVKTLAATESLKIGSAENYAQFDKDGLLSFAGKARPVRTIALAPEYPNAVKRGDGEDNFGFLETAVDELEINLPTYYKWITDVEKPQDYDIVVRIYLPNNFAGWAENGLSFNVWSDDIAKTKHEVTLINDQGASDENINNLLISPDDEEQELFWQTITVSAKGSYEAGTWVTLVIKLTSEDLGEARMGEIVLDYLASN